MTNEVFEFLMKTCNFKWNFLISIVILQYYNRYSWNLFDNFGYKTEHIRTSQSHSV